MIKDNILYCDRCKKEIIPYTAYCQVSASIIMFSPRMDMPMIFTCPEQSFNYSRSITMHSTCWIDTLRDHGIELLDLQKVAEEYKKRKEGGKDGVE